MDRPRRLAGRAVGLDVPVLDRLPGERSGLEKSRCP
jgi:hypothetical protein